MKYKKPIIQIDAGLAEGVYAASGQNVIQIVNQETHKYWDGGTDGYSNLSLDLSGVTDRRNVIVVMTFDRPIKGGYADGASNSFNGNQLNLSWYDLPATAIVTVQSDNIVGIQCTGCSVVNS